MTMGNLRILNFTLQYVNIRECGKMLTRQVVCLHSDVHSSLKRDG